MSTHRTAVWLDHREAKIFHVAAGSADQSKLLALRHHVRHSETTREPRMETFADHFFRSVAGALAESDEVLLVGPGSAKLEFIKYVHTHARELVPKLVGVETVDHPTDGQLVAYARKYFGMEDRVSATH